MEIKGEKSQTKNLIIAGAILILFGGGYYQYQKFSLKNTVLSHKDELKSLYESAKGKAKEGIKNKVGGMKQAIADKQNKLETATVAIDTANQGENKFVAVANTNGMIQLGSLSIAPKDADLMLMSAVKDGELARVRTLVEAGVSLNFTGNKVCLGDNRENTTLDIPVNADAIQNMYGTHPYRNGYEYLTDCSKLFLNGSVQGMRKAGSSSELYSLKNYGFDDKDMVSRKEQYLQAKKQDEDKILEEQKKEDIFNFMLEKTDFFINGNYTQLPFIYKNIELPFSVRVRALKTYVNVMSNPAKIKKVPNLVAFETLQKGAVDGVLASSQAGSSKFELATNAKNDSIFSHKQNDLLDDDLMLFIQEYMHNAGKYISSINNINESDLKKSGISYQSDLELSLNAFKENSINYTKNKQNMLFYTNTYDGFYNLDNTIELIKIINVLLDSQMVDLKRQYSDGSTVLHNIANIGSVSKEEGKALAILNRYLLNKGADSNLADKKGRTALGIAMANDSNGANNGVFKPLVKSFTEINFQK